MPVNIYIGPRKQGAPRWIGCIIAILVLCVGAYLAILAFAANGVYVASFVPLPDSLMPTATPTATPTETAASHMSKADAFFADGQLAAALAEYQVVVALEPKNALAYRRMVKPLILLRRLDEAVKAGRRAVELDDTSAENLAALAEALDWHGDYTEALDLALRATELKPQYAEAYSYAAEIYADLVRQDKALPLALKAVQLNDNSIDAHRNLAYVYEARGSYKSAVAEYQRAIQLGPKYAYLYIGLARNQRILNNFKDSIATLQQAIKIDPKNSQVFDELGWTYALSGDTTRAISQLKYAIELDPDYEVPYGHLAHVYFLQQNWEDMVTNLQKAIQHGGARLEYYYKLALAYTNLKDCTNAKVWVDKSVQLNAQDQAVQGAVTWYQQHCENVPPTPKKK